MLKAIIHRPGHGLEGHSATRLAAAYAQAIARGPDGVELDVRVTADGVPVVAHDPRARLASGWRPIAALRFEDLPPSAFLPLAELMPVFAGFAGRVYVEIKDVRQSAVERVLDVLAPWRETVWFISLPWKRDALRHILARWSEARANQIVVHPALSHVSRARGAGVGAVTFGWSGINAFRMLGRGPMVRRFLDSARESGLEVSAGLTNSRADLAWATAMGIDMVWVDPHALDLARAHQMNASAA